MEPEIGLKKIAINTLMQISKHLPELAKKVSSHETSMNHLSELLKTSEDN